jgi:hypothetical protein
VIDLERLAAHGLGLAGVRERTSAGRRGWYVDGRLVMRPEDADVVVVRCDIGERERLLVDHPETFSVPPRFAKHMMIVADVAGNPDAIEDAVIEAWEMQSGKRASA